MTQPPYSGEAQPVHPSVDALIDWALSQDPDPERGQCIKAAAWWSADGEGQ